MGSRAILVSLVSVIGVSFAFAAEDVDWQKPVPSQAKQVLHLTGKIVPQDGALSVLSSRVQGRILSFLKKEGEVVSVGTPLYAISSAECLSIMEERRVADSRGMKDLLEAINRRETQLGLKAAQDGCYLVSNFNGILIKRNEEIGMAFNIGDAMATVVDTKRLTVELEVPEKDISLVRINDVVRVHVSNSERELVGKVDVVVPSIDPITRTSRIRLKGVPLTGPVSLEALATGDLEVRTGTASAYQVPTTALVFYKNKNYVLKKKGKEATPVAVSIVSEIEGKSLVLPLKSQELSINDLVLTKGTLYMFNKMKSNL